MKIAFHNWVSAFTNLKKEEFDIFNEDGFHSIEFYEKAVSEEYDLIYMFDA